MATQAPQPDRIDIGRLVGRGLAVVKGHFLPFFAVSMLLCGFPAFVLHRLTSRFEVEIEATGAVTANQVATGVGALLIALATGCLVQGILARSTMLVAGGRPAELRRSAAQGLELLLPIVGVAVVTAVAVGLGLLLLVIPGIIVWIMLIVAVPALVEEQGGMARSLSRSAALTRGSRLMIFLLVLLFILAGYAISLAVGLSFVAVSIATGELTPFVEALAVAVDAAATGMLGAVMASSLYVELRVVREHATPEGIAGRLGAASGPSVRVPANIAAAGLIAATLGAMLLSSHVTGFVRAGGDARPALAFESSERASADDRGGAATSSGPPSDTAPPVAPRSSLSRQAESLCIGADLASLAASVGTDAASVCRCIGHRAALGRSDAEIERIRQGFANGDFGRLGEVAPECLPEVYPQSTPEQLALGRENRYRAHGVAGCASGLPVEPGVTLDDVLAACECAVDRYMRSAPESSRAAIDPDSWLETLVPELRRCTES